MPYLSLKESKKQRVLLDWSLEEIVRSDGATTLTVILSILHLGGVGLGGGMVTEQDIGNPNTHFKYSCHSVLNKLEEH